MRRSYRKSEIGVEALGAGQAVDGGQEGSVALREFERLFRKLPAEQREALVLVGAGGFSYPEAAGIAGCPTGTMKSRVARARHVLEQALDGAEPPEERAAPQPWPRTTEHRRPTGSEPVWVGLHSRS
ncbi:MAG: sigma factor-like helix-turn-helix DNA-binding protein [Aliidongia sp.]